MRPINGEETDITPQLELNSMRWKHQKEGIGKFMLMR